MPPNVGVLPSALAEDVAELEVIDDLADVVEAVDNVGAVVAAEDVSNVVAVEDVIADDDESIDDVEVSVLLAKGGVDEAAATRIAALAFIEDLEEKD
nr:hypothetical protein B0A51_06432 [Rachicladosporium sp. CCFEE 5018]